MNIVCFGQQNWDVCWTGKQQIMTRLARRGHRVLYVDPVPTRVASLGGTARALVPGAGRRGLRELGPGLWTFTPEYLAPLGWRLNLRRQEATIRALARRLGLHAPIAFTLRPDAGKLMAALEPAASVYYCVDEQTAFGLTREQEQRPDWIEAEERRQIREQEEALLRQVDLALGVSPRLVERFSRLQPRSDLLENGSDTEHFAPGRLARAEGHPALVGLPRPRLGFVGQVDERLDQRLLLELARARRDWQIVLAGRILADRLDVAVLEAEPNIHLLGYQPYEELPSILREFDVCLVPYRQTVLTHSCNPLKVFEYLATGRPVVSVPLEGLRVCRDAVALAEGTEGFLRAIEAALADLDADRDRRLALAAANTWDHRVDVLERQLEETLEVVARRKPRPSPGRGTLPGRHAESVPFRLDAQDEADWRLRGGYEAERLSGAGRATFAAARVAGRIYHALRVAGRYARGRRPALIRKILVARHGCHLGDLIAMLPTLAALRAEYPDAHIVLGTQAGSVARALLDGSQLVDEVRPLDLMARPSRRGRLAGLIGLFAEGFDLVLSGSTQFLSLEAFFAGAPYRIGLYDGHPQQALNGRVVLHDPTRHEAEDSLALVEALGARIEGMRRIPSLDLDPQRVKEGAARLLDRLGIPAGAPILAIHAGSKRPSRRWPVERFADLVGRLLAARPGLWAVFTGVPDEASYVEAIRSRLPEALRHRAPSSIGTTDLHSLVGLLDRSKTLLSNDTGVMHLGRARDTPLVALLGPGNDRRWGPHPRGLSPAVALRHDVPCAPCFRWDCEALYCLKSLSVDEVEAEVSRLLDSPGGLEGPVASLTRRSTRHNWEALAEAGFDLPLVSVVLFVGSPTGVPERSGEIEAALAAVEAQDYPRLEVIIVDLSSGGEPGIREGGRRGRRPVEVVSAPGDEPGAAWEAALGAASGEFIAPMVDGRDWKPGKISADVAILVRSPQAEAADYRPLDREAAAGGVPPLDLTTFRRSALASLLSDAGVAPDRPARRDDLAGCDRSAWSRPAAPPEDSDQTEILNDDVPIGRALTESRAGHTNVEP